MLIAPSTPSKLAAPAPTCPLWIQLLRCGMPSPFLLLLHTPTPSRHLSFGGWPLYFSAFSLRVRLRLPRLPEPPAMGAEPGVWSGRHICAFHTWTIPRLPSE